MYIFLEPAFGSNLDLNSIRRIKMIPKIDDENIEILGNVAGKGGIDIFLDEDKYEEMGELVNKIKHVELANHKDFNEVFAKNLMF